MKFRKKPIVIDAIQYDGSDQSIADISEFMSADRPLRWLSTDDSLMIDTLEGSMKANVGDWIIKGIKGECYPCKPDIFEATYEKVEVECYP